MAEFVRQELDTESMKMRFAGYSLKSKAYRLFDEANLKLYIWRGVDFNEMDFGQKVAMSTKPDQKSMHMEVKQQAHTTGKDEEVAEI